MAFRRGSFWVKIGLVGLGVAVADVAIWRTTGVGANLGLLALVWVGALALANPAVRRAPLAGKALLAAAFFAALQIERPTLVGLLLYVVAMGVAALAPRAPRGEDAFRWAQRLAAGTVAPVAGVLFDLASIRRAGARARRVRIVAILTTVALPLFGGAVFLSLFAAANPVIAGYFGGWRPAALDMGRLVFWAVLAFPLWVVLRPRGLRRTFRAPALERDFGGAFAGPAPVAASLALFNLIFGLQNGLDVAFLWCGAGLPEGTSFSEYAHRGAEPLIATALLAGLFVVVFLRPGSTTAASRPIRILVSVWVLQNLLLVASTALRTVDYIEAYSLTAMRLAALIWMGVVAAGLALILRRLLRGRSSSWLINANVAVVGIVLATCSVVDLTAVSAAWNIRHAREVGGRGVALDLCYMARSGGATAVSLAEMERRPLPADLRPRVAAVRQALAHDLWLKNRVWRGWAWRDARRLTRLEALGVRPEVAPPPSRCDGSPFPATAPAARPLTPAPNPRT